MRNFFKGMKNYFQKTQSSQNANKLSQEEELIYKNMQESIKHLTDGKITKNDILKLTISKIQEEYTQKSLEFREERRLIYYDDREYVQRLANQDLWLEQLIRKHKQIISKEHGVFEEYGDFEQNDFQEEIYKKGISTILSQTYVRAVLNKNIPLDEEAKKKENLIKFYVYLRELILKKDNNYITKISYIPYLSKNNYQIHLAIINDTMFQKFNIYPNLGPERCDDPEVQSEKEKTNKYFFKIREAQFKVAQKNYIAQQNEENKNN